MSRRHAVEDRRELRCRRGPLNTNVFGTVRVDSGAADHGGERRTAASCWCWPATARRTCTTATIDDFVTGRTVIPTPIAGYYGPIAAGSNGQYYLANDQLLNPALTSVGSSGGTGPVGGGGLPAPGGPTATGRPVAAVAAMGAQSFARYSMPVRASATAAPTDAGLLEIVDVTDTAHHRDGRGRSEGPLTARRRDGAGQHQRPHDGGGSGGRPTRTS